MVWNALMAKGHRLSEISVECPNIARMILIGTQARPQPQCCHDKYEGMEEHRLENHTFFVFPVPHRFNKSIGITFGIANTLNMNIEIIDADAGTGAIRGRVAMIRYARGLFDETLIGLYAPPPTSMPPARYNKLVNSMLAWLKKVLERLPTRTNILIGADLNADLLEEYTPPNAFKSLVITLARLSRISVPIS